MSRDDFVVNYFDGLQNAFSKIDCNTISDSVDLILDCYNSQSSIYIFGNGGSAATASHIACDFNKCVSFNLEEKFNCVCLCDSTPTIMALANDCGYENVFYHQLEGKLKKEDAVIAISGSGNSSNVIKAAEYAKKVGAKVITFTGYSGGKLLELSDCPIHVPINDMQKTEDCHMIVGHMIVQILAKHFGHPLC